MNNPTPHGPDCGGMRSAESWLLWYVSDSSALCLAELIALVQADARIAAAEAMRERCARVCAETSLRYGGNAGMYAGAVACEQAINARPVTGETT